MKLKDLNMLFYICLVRGVVSTLDACILMNCYSCISPGIIMGWPGICICIGYCCMGCIIGCWGIIIPGNIIPGICAPGIPYGI